MAKGIIYLMTTAVPGLIKIGQTASGNYEQRMYNLEHDGYRNVTALKRTFAIEVEDYKEKETLLHTIFEKSRVSDTELFALDVNTVIQLLSSFEGTVIFPKEESKEEIFGAAADTASGKIIPNGTYYFKRKKKSDGGKLVNATAVIVNGCWTIAKGSILGVSEDAGLSAKARDFRVGVPVDKNGKLLADVSLGECSPSFAGCVVLNQPSDGWLDWKLADGQPIDIFRKASVIDEEA